MNQRAKATSGTCIYAIGDIHGRPDLLRALHAKIQVDATHRHVSRRVVVYLGDYIDRGDDSRRVIDMLLDEPLEGFERIHLKGNHEDSLLRFLFNPSSDPGWLYYGAEATLYSYGVQPPLPNCGMKEFNRVRREFAENMPERHRQFLIDLPYAYSEGDYFFVHAGVRPGIPLERQTPDDMLWIRDEFLLSSADFGKVVVHGHNITEQPESHPNRIGVDTGACFTGRLSCVVLHGPDRTFLHS